MVVDYTRSIAASQALADKIVAYWAERGESVHAWVATTVTTTRNEKGEERSSPVYGVRSDMVNGMPRRKLAEAA